MPRLGGASQFGLLFWKELVLLKQKKCVTVFQISLPIAFAALLIVIRLVVNNSDRSDTTWNSFVPKTDHNGQLLRTKVLYTPDGQALNDTMVMVANKLGSNYSVMPFSSEALLNEYRLQNLDSVWAAVIFDSSGTYTTNLPDNVQYTLRVARKSGDDDWNTDDTYPFFQQPGYRDASAVGGEPYYYTTGFLGLQMVIDNAIINKQEGGTTYDGYTILMQKMAYIAHVSDGLIVVVQNWLPLFILLAFMITALQTTKSITYEKERRLKEAMKLMGMNTFVYWLIIFLKAFIFSLIAIFFFVILLKVDTGTNGRVLSQSNAGILLLFLILYSISLISYCIMMSTFFSKANVASNAAAVLYILMYVPWFFLTSRYEDMTRGQKLASCLLFNTAMAMGFNVVGLYEGAGSGAQFTNFYESATVDDNFALIHVMVMLLVDSAIMLLIAWYVGTVFPGDFGVPQPFYFPFTKTYWCGAEDPKDFDPALRPKTSPEFFEREPEGLKAGIEVRNLRKVFGRGEKKKIAVAGTNVTMYKGQITALLGHNGAGKTTTMSMLTGFLPPTSGSARVGGHDIVQNIEGVRRSLGMCPQHDILFDTMSVENHLQFYARMKGVDSKDLKKEVDEMINTLGLQTKRDALSMTLSGGQKRKLSVGIALIGGSEIVILDEPTSGMDPGARRQTWDILQKFRNDRCMVLSTHFMDEADVLGDRIAIMAEGVVKCCGTSLFLKKAFGAGYHLVMVKSTSGCNVDTVTQLIQSHIPSAIKESEISMELSYLLPFDQSSKFKSLFEEVETRSQSLGIASFGVSATTMEEVFLKVGESGAEEALEAKENLSPVHRPTSASGHGGKGEINGFVNNAFENGPPEKMEMKPITNGAPKDEGEESTSAFIETNRQLKKNHGLRHSTQQFWAMFIKKVIHTWRNRIVTFVQFCLPILFTIFALLVEGTSPGYTEEPALVLNLSPFGTYTTLARDGAASTTIDDTYKTLFCTGCVTDISSSSSFDTGSLSIMTSTGITTFSSNYIIGADFNASSTFIAFFNGEPYHSPAVALNFLNNALLQSITSSSTKSISVTNYPFDRDLSDNANSVAGSAFGTGFSIAFLILFGMAFLSTSFIIFLIKERMNGAKHLQKVSGVGSFVFWLSTFAWDYINYVAPSLICIIVFAAYNTDEYSGGSPSRIGLVFWLFVTYGWTCLPFIYIFSFAFKTPAGGMVAMTLLNIVTGLATLIAVFVLSIPSLGTEDIAKALDWVFAALIPHYNLGLGIMNVYVNYNYLKTCEDAGYQTTCASGTSTSPCCDYCTSNCLTFTDNYLDMASPGIGKNLLFMSIQGLVFFIIILLAEYQVFTRIMYSISKPKNRSAVGSIEDLGESSAMGQRDDDVVNEEKRINQTAITTLMGTDKLIVKNISKYYGNFHAVQNVSVGVASQECFGLLGQNGAGKTTTFKMLTGDEMISSGSAYLEHHDVKTAIKQVQKNLGYCPQFDGLIEQMTGREILYMFARLRGVQEAMIKSTVDALVKALMLEKHADRECGTYSGGNKRKLSTAMALIGDPPFIFLDEPTTGMDPGARRQLWNVLSQIRASGRTLVLTSHSMEECDALCTRIVIMVNGRFVCLGSPQHLKNKFGHGYTLIIQMGLQFTDSNALTGFIKEKFPNSAVFDNHQGYLHFQIPDSGVSLSEVFGVMETCLERFKFEDYSVHQTTLEQVFLQFTRDQHLADDRKKKGGCCGCL